MPRPIGLAALLLLLPLVFVHCGTAYLERDEAGPDYLIQGEYAALGASHAAQLVARGSGAFELVLFEGGLPGDGWNGSPPRRIAGTRVSETEATFRAPALEANIEGGSLRLRAPDAAAASSVAAPTPELELPRIERHSPTEGAKAPVGARVVFARATAPGSGTNATDGEVDSRGWLAAGAESNEAFGSMQLHLEFQTPFMPDSTGQARGNSGVYIEGRYEVQVLDSFGLAPAANDCAAIYEVAPPLLNMSFPPLQWQTYDIDFETAAFDAAGNKVAPARVSVRHNGVLVQDRVAIPAPTGLGDAETPTAGRLLLQNHWNPVYFRNVWVVPK